MDRVVLEFVIVSVEARNSYRLLPGSLCPYNLLHLAPDVNRVSQRIDWCPTEMLLSVQGIFSAIKRVALTQALQWVQNIKIMSWLVLSTDGRVLLCWFQRTKSICVNTAWAKNRFLSELAVYPRVNFELIRIELRVVVLCINVKWLL